MRDKGALTPVYCCLHLDRKNEGNLFREATLGSVTKIKLVEEVASASPTTVPAQLKKEKDEPFLETRKCVLGTVPQQWLHLQAQSRWRADGSEKKLHPEGTSGTANQLPRTITEVSTDTPRVAQLLVHSSMVWVEYT